MTNHTQNRGRVALLKLLRIPLWVAVAALMTPTLSSADESLSARQVTSVPQATPDFKSSNTVVFDLAPSVDGAWKVGAAVHSMENKAPALPNLIIGNCGAHPSAGCVKVNQINKAKPWWYRWDTQEAIDYGKITLNARHGKSKRASCDATAQVIAIVAHHRRGKGCTRVNAPASAKELGGAAALAIQNAYN